MNLTSNELGGAVHVSPAESPEHLALRAAARKGQQDEETLRTVLWLVNASDCLLGLRTVARNLSFLLAKFRNLAEGSTTVETSPLFLQLQGSSRVLGWIQEKLSPAVCPEASHSGNPNFGHAFLRNPLWSALWVEPTDAGVAKQYRVLQFHFLYAHASYLWNGSRNDPQIGRLAYEQYGGQQMWAAFPESPYPATLGLRNLANSRWAPVVQQVPTHALPRKFIEDLATVGFPGDPESTLAKSWAEIRGTICAFLSRAHGFEPWAQRVLDERTALPSRPPGTITVEDVTLVDPDDPETIEWPETRIVTTSSALTPDVTEEALESDLDPDELAGHDQCYLSAIARRDLQRIAIDAALSARSQYRHLQMRHQLLPFEYNIPAAEEMRLLLESLERIWLELGDERLWDGAQRSRAETVALIQIMVWLGFSLKRVHEMVVLGPSNSSNLSVPDFPIGTLLYDSGTAEWIVPVDSPPYKTVIEDAAGQAHFQQNWLTLQDVAGLGRFVNALNPAVSGQTGHALARASSLPGALFLDKFESYELSIRHLLSHLCREGRVTFRRLGLFLFNRLVAISGDLMAGSLITGQYGPLTRTERFYASYAPGRLRSLYYRASANMVEQLTGKTLPAEKPNPHPSFGVGHVGARLCAKDDEVERAIREIGDAIEAKRNVKRLRIDYHNLLTLHSVLLFCFCTSCRPVRAPYLPLERVDKDTGFAYLSDKDDDAHHKARLVWVPKLCTDQMERYQQHCERLKGTPAIRTWPDPCFFLSSPADGNRSRSRVPEMVRPRTISGHLKPYLQLPLNFYRKYLRHRMLESGCPPEIVMAWLGHAFAGEEIWNPRSAISPVEYRNCLDQYLVPIIENLGWKVR